MNALERMLKAFNHEEADRVPTFLQSMMPNFIKKCEDKFGDEITDDDVLYIGKDFTLYVKLGLDSGWGAPLTTVRYEPETIKQYPLPNLGPNLHVDRTGRITESGTLNGHPQTWVRGSIFKTLEEAEAWWERYIKPMPEPIPDGVKMTNQMLRSAGPILWNKFVPVAGIHGLIEPLMEGLGMSLFSRALRKNRDILHKMMQWQTNHAVERTKMAVETDYMIFALADDSAYKNSPMLNPKDHMDLVVPYYKQVSDIVRKAGKYIFFHSDGFTEPYFPGLIKAGFHGVESLEVQAGMDLKHLKETYGDKLCLIGNIDPWNGTPETITERVKQCIKDAAEGGGYIVSPCTDFTDDVAVENAIAMVEAVKKFGVYNH